MKSFEPTTPLEHAFADAQSGGLSAQRFMEIFVSSEIFVLSANELQHDGSGLQPLVFKREEVEMVACFTSLGLTKDYSEMLPYCLSINSLKFFSGLAQGLGVVVNPGHAVGAEFSPQSVAEVLAQFRDQHGLPKFRTA